MNKQLSEASKPSVIELVQTSEQVALSAIPTYTKIVEDIIEASSTDIKLIEDALDYMLDLCFNEQILEQFKKLCKYYFYIDESATIDYVNAYHNIWENDPNNVSNSIHN